jgi:hypothetical protein
MFDYQTNKQTTTHANPNKQSSKKFNDLCKLRKGMVRHCIRRNTGSKKSLGRGGVRKTRYVSRGRREETPILLALRSV